MIHRLALPLFLVAIASAQSTNADKHQLLVLEQAYASAKKALTGHPKDPTARKNFVVATDRFATATMGSLYLTPHEKYPKALRLYREVLKVDPSNHEASNNASLIISIYKSMHRPVPK